MLTAILSSTLSSVARGFSRLATNLRNRRALLKLNELDDHLLADIGLTRGSVSMARSQPLLSDPFNIDPFDARRRIHASDLDILARWPRPLPEQTYRLQPKSLKIEACCAAPAE